MREVERQNNSTDIIHCQVSGKQGLFVEQEILNKAKLLGQLKHIIPNSKKEQNLI